MVCGLKENFLSNHESVSWIWMEIAFILCTCNFMKIGQSFKRIVKQPHCSFKSLLRPLSPICWLQLLLHLNNVRQLEVLLVRGLWEIFHDLSGGSTWIPNTLQTLSKKIISSGCVTVESKRSIFNKLNLYNSDNWMIHTYPAKKK